MADDKGLAYILVSSVLEREYRYVLYDLFQENKEIYIKKAYTQVRASFQLPTKPPRTDYSPLANSCAASILYCGPR